VKPRPVYVAFVTAKGAREGMFHDDYCRGRPLCVETTERRCRSEVSAEHGGCVMPRDSYQVIRYVPEAE
jgi:hypothetical protein